MLKKALDAPSLLRELIIKAPGRTLRSRNLLNTVPRRTLDATNDPELSMARQFNDLMDHFNFDLWDISLTNHLLPYNFGVNSR